MFLIAAALVLLVKAGITNLKHCAYTDSNCSQLVSDCLDVCADTSICPSSSCDSMKATYTATGMSEYGECYHNSGFYYITNCTYEEPKECSDYDICHVLCTTNNGECGGSCTFVGQYVTNSSNLNCDDEQVLTYYSNQYSAFERFSECFINTDNDASGEDQYLICNMGFNSSDSSVQYTKFVVPIVCITAVYCCIWFVWRRSEAEDEKFSVARQLSRANTKFFGGSSDSQTKSTGTTKPI